MNEIVGRETVDLGVEGLSPAVYVGAGGSANVFAARIVETGEEVAVKLLRASADSAKERERFARERETLDLLSTHEGIVHVVDAGVTDRNEPYFLMPLMEGSLQDRIETEGALDWETASQLIAEVADTIEFAHTKKILHRDLKPGNILLDNVGVPRVADFGIAKLMDSSVSKSSKALGTPSFMPPERFRAAEATEASDVYGLGATLAALLTGTAPFLTGENDTDAAVMMRVMSEEPAELTLVGIPESIAGVVTRSMAKDPNDRPESAADFAQLLRTATLDAGGAVAAGPVTVAIPHRDLMIPEFAAIEADEEDDKEKKPILMLAVAAAIFATIIGVGGALALTRGETTEVASGSQEEIAAQVAGEIEEQDANAGSSAIDENASSNSDSADEAADGENADELRPFERTAVTGIPLDGSGAGSDDEANNTSSTGATTSGATGTPTAGTNTSSESSSTNTTSGTTTNATGTAGGTTTGGTTTGGTTTGGTTTGGEATTPTSEVPPPPAEPEACFSTSKSSVETGSSVSFSNCSTEATSYEWEFGDGTTSSQSSPAKSWSTAGTKTVRLTASGAGGTDTRTVQITVTEVPPPPVKPTACFTASKSSVETGSSVSFSNCSQDATAYAWEFGDGTTSSLSNPSKSWSATGTKTVKMTATGPGGTHSTSKQVTVTAPAVAPTACFNASNSNPVVNNDSVSFTNCSTDATSYHWNFGDGTSSSERNPSHTYNRVGTFTVTLTATGQGDNSTSKTITVKNQDRLVNDPPQAENISCQNISATEERWTWDVYGRVNDYVMVLSGGSTSSMGRTSGFVTSNNSLKAIVSKRDGLDTRRDIGSPSSYGCTGWVTPTVPAPTGVSCSFSNFQANDANTNWKSWTSHWKWNVHGDVDSYIVEFDTTGKRINVGKTGSYTATNVKGFRDGSQIQKIIAVKGGVESQPRTLTSCGSEGGGPTWQDFGS